MGDLKLEVKEIDRSARIKEAVKILSQVIQHKDEQELITGVIAYLKQERGSNEIDA